MFGNTQIGLREWKKSRMSSSVYNNFFTSLEKIFNCFECYGNPDFNEGYSLILLICCGLKQIQILRIPRDKVGISTVFSALLTQTLLPF